MRHAPAVIAIACAAVLDLIGGILFAAAEHIPVTSGLYWAVTTATTVGYGDIEPRNPAGRLIAVFVMLTVIPLFGATFSLFTSGLAGVRIERLSTGLHTRLQRIEENHRQVCHHLGLTPVPPVPPGPGLPGVQGG
jgi:voltage-gated potassium channel